MKINKCELKNRVLLWIVCLALAFVALTICSSNSFLHSFNDWVDLNWYMTMGNGLLSGKIPYKDLFEQKGPLTYFLFAFFCLFKNPYIVVYIFEIVCATVFFVICFRIALKFLNKWLAFCSVALMSVLVYTSPFFVLGGGAIEEYCLPIIAYFVLFLIEFLSNPQFLTKTKSVVLGVLLAIFCG